MATMWWFEAVMWNWGEFDRIQDSAVIADFYSTSLYNHLVTALIAQIPILLANWSRTIWPRIALAAVLIVAQVVCVFIFIPIPW